MSVYTKGSYVKEYNHVHTIKEYDGKPTCLSAAWAKSVTEPTTLTATLTG